MILVSRKSSKYLLKLNLFNSITIDKETTSFLEPTITIDFSSKSAGICALDVIEKLFQSVALPFVIKTPSTLNAPKLKRHFFPYCAQPYEFSKQRPNGYSVREYYNNNLCSGIIQKELNSLLEYSPFSLPEKVNSLKLIQKSSTQIDWLETDAFMTPMMMDIIYHLTTNKIDNLKNWYEKSTLALLQRLNEKVSVIQIADSEIATTNIKTIKTLITRHLFNLAKLLSFREQCQIAPIIAMHLSHSNEGLGEISYEGIKDFALINSVVNAHEANPEPHVSGIIYHKVIAWAKINKNYACIDDIVQLLKKSRHLDIEEQHYLMSALNSKSFYKHKALLAS